MAVYYRTKAIVFAKRDRAEADRSFSVFAEGFGRLEIFAKAIRKIASKLKSGIDSFYLSEIEFVQGKSQKTLTDAMAIDKFKNITENAHKFKIAGSIAEVLDDVIRGQEKDEGLWLLITEVFERLDNMEQDNWKLDLLYCYFLWNMLSLLGYGPQAEVCGLCKARLNPYGIYFSAEDGGIVCKACFGAGSRKINSDFVKILRIILKKDWETLVKIKMQDQSKELLKGATEEYYKYISSNLCQKQQSF